VLHYGGLFFVLDFLARRRLFFVEPGQFFGHPPVGGFRRGGLLNPLDGDRRFRFPDFIRLPGLQFFLWEQRNRERLAKIAKMPPKPGQEEIWNKLQAWKMRLAQEQASS
jgi:hypothetical protein